MPSRFTALQRAGSTLRCDMLYALCFSLTLRLVENNPCGYRNIERVKLACLRDKDDVINKAEQFRSDALPF